MERGDIIQRVNDTLHNGFEIPQDKLVATAHLYEDLKLDSLDAVDLMVHLEDKLGIKVEGEAFKDVRTLDDVYGMVEKMVTEKGVAGSA